MQIGELARRTGFSPKTIRYYEEIGLLPPPGRTATGYRRYGAETVSTLEFVRRAKLLGMSLEEIGQILALYARGEEPCDRVRVSIDAELDQLDRRIQELQQLRERLWSIRASMPVEVTTLTSPSCICPIIERQEGA